MSDPTTPGLLMKIAQEVGYETDNEGQAVIYTGLYECREHDGLFDDNPGKTICMTCEDALVIQCTGCGQGFHPEPSDETLCVACGNSALMSDPIALPSDDDKNRCEHGMFFTGAGACPQCGGGAE